MQLAEERDACSSPRSEMAGGARACGALRECQGASTLRQDPDAQVPRGHGLPRRPPEAQVRECRPWPACRRVQLDATCDAPALGAWEAAKPNLRTPTGGRWDERWDRRWSGGSSGGWSGRTVLPRHWRDDGVETSASGLNLAGFRVYSASQSVSHCTARGQTTSRANRSHVPSVASARQAVSSSDDEKRRRRLC